MKQESNHFNKNENSNRRHFVKQSLVVAISGVAGLSMLSGCKENEEGDGQEVSPPEDLMQEHGVLNRILLIYDTCKMYLVNNSIILDLNK